MSENEQDEDLHFFEEKFLFQAKKPVQRLGDIKNLQNRCKSMFGATTSEEYARICFKNR